MIGFKVVEARIDSRFGDRSILASAFDAVYLPVDDSGVVDSNMFNIRLSRSPNPSIVVLRVEDGYGSFEIEGVVDRNVVEVDAGRVSVSISGRDLIAYLIDKRLKKREYIGVTSIQRVVADVLQEVGIGVHFGIPDYVLCEGYEIGSGTTVAQVVQNLLGPFMQGAYATLDMYVRNRILYINWRSLSNPPFGSVVIPYGNVISVDFNLITPEILDSDTVAAVGGACPQLVPDELPREVVETTREETVIDSTESVLERRLLDGRDALRSERRSEVDESVVRDENGELRILIFTQIITDYYRTIVRNRPAVSKSEVVLEDKYYSARPFGPDKEVRPSWSLPDLDLAGMYWSATERRRVQSTYEGDKKVFEVESVLVHFVGGAIGGSVFARDVSEKRVLRSWEYDDFGDVSKFVEQYFESGYNSEGEWVEDLNSGFHIETYLTDSVYKERRVREYNLREGRVVEREYVDRSPVRDDSLIRREGEGEGVEVAEGWEIERRRVVGTSVRVSESDRRADQNGRNSLVRKVEQVNEEESTTQGRRSEVSRSNSRIESEERSVGENVMLRTRFTRGNRVSEEFDSKTSEVTELSEEGKTVTVSSISGENFIVNEREDKTVSETREADVVRGNRVVEERRSARATSETSVRVSTRPAKLGDVELPEPPPGFRWERVEAKYGDVENATVVLNLASISDLSLMGEIVGRYEWEAKRVRVEADLQTFFDSRIVPGSVLTVSEAPSWWPINSFYVVGIRVDSDSDRSVMSVYGYAWI